MVSLVTASAPGKVILMGEHAAVYGYPAIVAALDLRTEATAELRETAEQCECAETASPSALERNIRVELPDLGATVDRPSRWMVELGRRVKDQWQRFDEGAADFASPSSFLDGSASPGDAAAAFVQLAIAEAMSVARPGAEHTLLRVYVRSAAPSGAGFGSSAAVATAVVAAVLGALETRGGLAVHLRGAARDELVEGLALQVERLQHGRPSGVDTAAVRRGGVLRMARSDGSDGQVLGKLVASPLDVSSDALAPFVLIHSGSAAESTGAVVTAVRRRRDAEPEHVDALLGKIGECTERMAGALRRSAREEVASTIRSSQRLLERLGVVPEPVQKLVRRLETAGAAAKISGAGSLAGPGAGAVLVYDPDDVLSRSPIDEILGDLRVDLPEAVVLRPRFGAPGLRTRFVPGSSVESARGAPAVSSPSTKDHPK